MSRERVVERVWRNDADNEVEEGGSDGGLRCSCLRHTWTIPKCRAWPRVAWRSQATSVPWPSPPIVSDGTVLRTDRTQNLPDAGRDRRQRLASPCARSTPRVTHATSHRRRRRGDQLGTNGHQPGLSSIARNGTAGVWRATDRPASVVYWEKGWFHLDWHLSRGKQVSSEIEGCDIANTQRMNLCFEKFQKIR